MDEFTSENREENYGGFNSTTPANEPETVRTNSTEPEVNGEYSSSSLNRNYASNYAPNYAQNYSQNYAPDFGYQTYTQPETYTTRSQSYAYHAPEQTNPYYSPYERTTGYGSQTSLADKPKKERRGMSKGWLIVLCAVIGLIAGMFGSVLTSRLHIGGTADNVVIYQTPEASEDSESSSEGTTAPVSNSVAGDITSVVSAVQDSVVSITTEAVATGSFFQEYVTTGAGSGVIISEDGYILTCNHVIEGASNVTVKLYNGDEYKATVVGFDSKTDLAVVKIEASGLSPAVFGDEDSIKIGQAAIAIGNPLGTLGNSVSSGIISALEREVTVSNQTMRLLQTDTPVNPGNSGGGLFDIDGNLIGIVNAKYKSEGVEGIGFAIPIDTIKSITPSLIESGYVTGRPALGVQVVTVASNEVAQYGVTRPGVYIYSVNEGEAADKAGLVAGDYIFSADDVLIETYSDLSEVLSNHEIGDTVSLTIIRENQTLNIDVVLGELHN